MRTHIHLEAHTQDKLMVSSIGFDSVEVELKTAPFDHPLGLMMAVAAFFQADGVRIRIESTSPPRSALGGSSVAAVALIWAFYKVLALAGKPMPEPGQAAWLAQAIEQSVIGAPCGPQDQLAAAFGGVNAWYWTADSHASTYIQKAFSKQQIDEFSRRIIVAYCGLPHSSIDINGRWIRGFIRGTDRVLWTRIISLSRRFVQALEQGDYAGAQESMNQETQLRLELTPQVLDDMGQKLVTAAHDHGCGARFTGAGGGGCVWALGLDESQIQSLRTVWQSILNQGENARLLDTHVDLDGVL
jgi:D-glycero-alpha-D-manno-heptose-7-phosphate kinase